MTPGGESESEGEEEDVAGASGGSEAASRQRTQDEADTGEGDSHGDAKAGASQTGPYIEVAVGLSHTLALKPDGTLACWVRARAPRLAIAISSRAHVGLMTTP